PALERDPGRCVGCRVCYLACPYEAVREAEDTRARRPVRITVQGESFEVPERITIRQALELLGFSTSRFPGEGDLPVPCETGGCFSCAVYADGQLVPACITPVADGMDIRFPEPGTRLLRRVSGFQPHPVGGVGTPWWLKDKGTYIEVACFAHGCNLKCPQCQNYTVTYDNVERPLRPEEASRRLTALRRLYGVDRMAISGGEPTLNRPWLVAFFKALRTFNKDERARFHLDTNATVLTPDYIDELVLDAGVTDIGPDLKGLRLETFMAITGIKDRELARRYHANEWAAVKYILDHYYPERVFMGIGIPYNPAFMSLEELRDIGDRIASMDPGVQVCLLDYFPTFRRKDITRPSFRQMLKAREILLEAGLKTVIAQTELGHVGP
ncbi:radical SAM protein, partial [Candidatus Bathyarchaeota archaeon]